MEQRVTFDKIASLYDAARPDYPEALFGDIAGTADLAPGEPVLEIGCGTGRATQGLARLGAPILALDPGPALLEVARARLADFANVRFAEATFEAWPLEPETFKLVAAAQSWHWIAPEVRFVKAAAALKAGGFLAVFGNVSMPLKAPLGPALDDLYARHAPRLIESAPGDWYLPGVRHSCSTGLSAPGGERGACDRYNRFLYRFCKNWLLFILFKVIKSKYKSFS